MISTFAAKLLACFGEIKESYIEEAMEMQYSHRDRRALRKKRVGFGASSVAIVTGIAMLTYYATKRRRVA